jgi:glycosyltransferase involved in cell wall biosynthesis
MNSKQELPMVSVCTPTFNRRPFIQNMFNCFINQDYPKHLIEWIIVDDGTDKIKDLVLASGIPQIRYFEVPNKMSLGAKRNYMHTFVRGSIIVYMDDDDYYPPERISHAVERLQSKPEALCAGSSEIYIYFKTMNKMIQCGPYNDNHATAGTFAFRTEMLKNTKYEDHAALAEERAFLKEYTIPFVQLDPLKTILVFSHDHNTFDKRKMFEQNQDPRFFKESPKTVDTFIRKPYEMPIRKFFMEDIDKLLEHYEPGRPHMKPDALKQMKEIEERQQKMIAEAMAAQKANGQILLQQPGKDPIALTSQQVVDIIKQQQERIAAQEEKINQNNKYIALLQQKLNELKSAKPETASSNEPASKLNEYMMANQTLQNKLIASVSEITALKNELNATKITPDVTRFNQLTSENKNLENRVFSSIVEINSLKQQISNQQNEITNHAKRINDYIGANKTLETKLRNAMIDVDKLKEANYKLTQQVLQKSNNADNVQIVQLENTESNNTQLPNTKGRPEIVVNINDV